MASQIVLLLLVYALICLVCFWTVFLSAWLVDNWKGTVKPAIKRTSHRFGRGLSNTADRVKALFSRKPAKVYPFPVQG